MPEMLQGLRSRKKCRPGAFRIPEPQEDEDDLALARWECRNVERRLEQARIIDIRSFFSCE